MGVTQEAQGGVSRPKDEGVRGWHSASGGTGLQWALTVVISLPSGPDMSFSDAAPSRASLAPGPLQPRPPVCLVITCHSYQKGT